MDFGSLRSSLQLRDCLISACEKLLVPLEPLALTKQRDTLQRYMHALHSEQLPPILLAEQIENVIADVLSILAYRCDLCPVASMHIASVVFRNRLEPYRLLEQIAELRLRSVARIVEARCGLMSILNTMFASFSCEMSGVVEQWSQWYDGGQTNFRELPHTYQQQEDEGMQFLYSLMLWFADRFRQRFHDWLTNVLQPFMQTKMVAMMHMLKEPCQQFFVVLAQLHELMGNGDASWLEYGADTWSVDEWQIVMEKIEQKKVSEIIAYVEHTVGNAWCEMLSSVYLLTENGTLCGQQVEFDTQLLQAMLVRHYQCVIETIHKRWTRYAVNVVDAGLRELQETFDNYLCMCADSVNPLITEDFDAWEMCQTVYELVKIDVAQAIEQFQALYDVVDIRLKEQE